jgi:hypothetical protein
MPYDKAAFFGDPDGASSRAGSLRRATVVRMGRWSRPRWSADGEPPRRVRAW